jgi:hypothetical protein
MAFFNYVHLNAKENLLKNVMENSNEWDFDSLSQICYSLSKLNDDNTTVLEIIKRRIIAHTNYNR